MLPTGHIAGGYLVTVGLIKLLKPDFSAAEQTQLYFWGMFWAFAPDLDIFYFFLKNRNFLVAGREGKDSNHRKYYSHFPFLWLLAGIFWYFLTGTVFWKFCSLLFVAGSFSHFFLDSIDYGIRWLWPLSNKLYALKNIEAKLVVEERNFFRHSLLFLKAYSKYLTFYLEIIIILSAIFVAIIIN